MRRSLKLHNFPELSMYPVDPRKFSNETFYVVAVGDVRLVFEKFKTADRHYNAKFKAMLRQAKKEAKR